MINVVNIALTANLPQPYTKIHLLHHLPGFHLEPHFHSISHLIVIFEGNLQVNYQNRTFHLHEGNAILLPSGIPHELLSETGYSQVGIDLLDLSALDTNDDKRNIRRILADSCPSGFEVVSHLSMPCSFNEIYDILHNLTPFTTLKLLTWIDTVVISFIESVHSNYNNDFKRRFLDLLSSNNGYKLSLLEICNGMNLSKTHLERLTLKEFGCGAVEYCMRMRIVNACALLMDTELPISEIADRLGFNSAAHFSYCFKLRQKMTPREFRNSSRELQKVNIAEE